MCDNDRNGVIDKGELSEMLRSLVEIARTTSLSDEHVTELIDGMFQVWANEKCNIYLLQEWLFYFYTIFYLALKVVQILRVACKLYQLKGENRHYLKEIIITRL